MEISGGELASPSIDGFTQAVGNSSNASKRLAKFLLAAPALDCF